MPVADYPARPATPEVVGTVDGEAFAHAIQQVIVAASKDDTLPILTGVKLEFEGDTISFLATDRYRLSLRELNWKPAKSEISKILGSNNPHPKQKHSDPRFGTMSLVDALQMSIGSTLTERLFSSWLEMYDSGRVVRAVDHRLVWAPLYWPETVFETLNGEKFLDPIPFLTTSDVPLAKHIHNLVDSIGDLEFDKGNQHPEIHLNLRKPVAGAPIRKSSVELTHFCIGETYSHTEFLPETPFGISRAHFSRGLRQNGSASSSQPVVTLEVPKPYGTETSPLVSSISYLENRGIHLECDGHVVSAAVHLQGSLQAHEADFDPLSSAFGSHGTSFNDHVARGLASARAIAQKVGK
jgi:hypothetical protein